MSQHYLEENRAEDPHYLPSIEVFYLEDGEQSNEDGEPLSEGYYWQSCLPGCLPDGEPSGPFDSEQEALDDAREGLQ